VQGRYRILGGGFELVESFVAAAGPAGWRYFGRVHRADTGEETYLVDHVAGLDWTLVRFRMAGADGSEIVARPGADGLEVEVAGPDGGRSLSMPGATEVWAPSPVSLLVAHRRFAGFGTDEFSAARIELPSEIRPVDIRIEAAGPLIVRTPGGAATAERITVNVDGRAFDALVRSDLPLRADGWFELEA
jgi:hypothetical protein